MPESSLMRMSNASLCLGLGPLCVPTCQHARDCGARHHRERSMGARPSTCRGQTVRPVETTCGASGQNVSTRALEAGQLWMVGGGNGTGNGGNRKINKIMLSHRWSECSRTCGGGIRKSVRECDNPTPLNGGLYCTGDRLRYESCHTKDCHQASDLRLEQCKAYNANNFKIDDLPAWVEWVPKYTDSEQR